MIGIYRILDANINRVSEGIRVVEDISRFNFENEIYTEKLRIVRHTLRKLFIDIDIALINARDSQHDIGKTISAKSTLDKKTSLDQLIMANFKRATEGLRAIEESLKIIGKYEQSKVVESLRYESYYLEKGVLGLLKKSIPEGLYGITAEKFSNGKSNYEVVKEMLEAGVKIVQYREKDKKMGVVLEECKALRELTKEYGATFIVNDYIDIALIVDADGVHVGQEDLPVSEVRKLVGDKIIGVSTHCEEDAQKAVKDGADYIGVGPIFATQTKVDVCEPIGFEYLEYVVKNINIPFVSIGGIKEHNIDEIVKRGAKNICLVTEIVGSKDIKTTIKNLNEKIKI